MAAVYALDSLIEVIDGVRIGRLVYRYSTVDGRTALDPDRVNQLQEQACIGPHRRYWLGLEDRKPRLVRLDYGDGTVGDTVYLWSRQRVSWKDTSPLAVAGRIVDGHLLLEAGNGSRVRVLEFSKKGVLAPRRKRIEIGPAAGAPDVGVADERGTEDLAGGAPARAA